MQMHYHVTIVKRDGSSIVHRGLIRTHATLIFQHATTQQDVAFAMLGSWLFELPSQGVRWQCEQMYINRTTGAQISG